MRYYKEEDVLKKLKGFVYSEYGSMKDYAESLGVTVQFISQVLNGKRTPTQPMLTGIGVIRESVTTVTYKKA